MSDERPLPTGWWKTTDATSGKIYYYTADGKRQWHFPGDPEPDAEAEPEDVGRRNQTHQNSAFGDLSGFERSITKSILMFVFFPFQSIPKALIWGIVQVIFIIFEIVIGFVCLKDRGEIPVISDNDNDNRQTAIVAVFLIVDGFVWLVESLLHFALLGTGAAKYLLENPPTFESSPLDLFDQSHSTEKALFMVNLVAFCIFRIFQLVWSIVASFRFALMQQTFSKTITFARLISIDIESFLRVGDLLRGIAIAYLSANFASLALWGLLFSFLGYLRYKGSSFFTKKGS